MRRRTGWPLGLAMAMAVLVPVDQGVLAQERRCRDSDASCRSLVGGIGEAPARVAWLARTRTGASEGHHRGIELVQVLEARHADVIAAEAALKRQKKEAAVPLRKWHTWRMPESFLAGTEVVRGGTQIKLAEVLPGGRDVTALFATGEFRSGIKGERQ